MIRKISYHSNKGCYEEKNVIVSNGCRAQLCNIFKYAMIHVNAHTCQFTF